MKSKSSTSCGPDGVSPLFLKMLTELSEPLCNLFSMSVQQGCVPKVWQIAKVIPIFKGKGSMLEVKNYRPISLINVYCKALERLVRNKIMSYLESENLLSTCQSSFRSGLSTLTQQINAQALIVDNINQLKCVDGVYSELSKAFDTITHSNLLLKLRAFDIHGHLYDWITSFLTDRLQFVSINSVSSAQKTLHQWRAAGKYPQSHTFPSIHKRFTRVRQTFIYILIR